MFNFLIQIWNTICKNLCCGNRQETQKWNSNHSRGPWNQKILSLLHFCGDMMAFWWKTGYKIVRSTLWKIVVPDGKFPCFFLFLVVKYTREKSACISAFVCSRQLYESEVPSDKFWTGMWKVLHKEVSAV